MKIRCQQKNRTKTLVRFIWSDRTKYVWPATKLKRKNVHLNLIELLRYYYNVIIILLYSEISAFVSLESKVGPSTFAFLCFSFITVCCNKSVIYDNTREMFPIKVKAALETKYISEETGRYAAHFCRCLYHFCDIQLCPQYNVCQGLHLSQIWFTPTVTQTCL